MYWSRIRPSGHAHSAAVSICPEARREHSAITADARAIGLQIEARLVRFAESETLRSAAAPTSASETASTSITSGSTISYFFTYSAPTGGNLDSARDAAELQERDGYVSDISLALRYRPELFGEPFSELLQEVMKGPSEWTEAERELFARLGREPPCRFDAVLLDALSTESIEWLRGVEGI